MDKEFDRLRQTLAANVLRLRKSKSLSQEQLAFDAAIDRTYVSQIERCVNNPSMLVLHKLATALDSSVTELLISQKS